MSTSELRKIIREALDLDMAKGKRGADTYDELLDRLAQVAARAVKKLRRMP